MATRSRKGCIDCKQAKIKCDEVHPFCGTCTRRRRQCRGYSFPLNNRSLSLRETRPAAQAQAQAQTSWPSQTQTQTAVLPEQRPPLLQPGGATAATFAAATAAAAAASIAAASHDPTGLTLLRPDTLLPGLAWTPLSAATSASALTATYTAVDTSAHFAPWTTAEYTELTDEEAQSLAPSSSQPVSSSSSSSLITHSPDAPYWVPAPGRGLSWLPSEITPADRPLIDIYFMRHPTEMVMSNDFFIAEMNYMVLSLLQRNPADVGASLSAIGENYLKNGTSSALVSNRKNRLLSRLRFVNEKGTDPDLILLILLALCGAELTDPFSDGMGTSLRALIENVALILELNGRTGRALNDQAKYFARGVARQDLLIALARMQRPRIDPMLWLDEHSMTRADRLFGLTTTLTPVLAQLAGLAEDVQTALDEAVNLGMLPPLGEYCPLPPEGDANANDPLGTSSPYPSFPDFSSGSHYLLTQRPDLAEREASVRAQLLAWRPVNDTSLSLRASRKFLLHASAWRSAALLYLFRLFNRAGSAPAADHAAQGMAYEVMMHVSGQPEDTKLSLWPLFVAACEMDHPEDRDTATQLFDSVTRTRPLLTALRTRALCTDHIWPARDRGDIWDWMYLARQSSYVYIPL